MRRTRVITIATAVTLLPLSAMMPASATASSPTKTQTIMFDGFCDGMTINMPAAGVGVAGTLDGAQAGCETNPIFGTAAPKGKKKYNVNKSTEFITLQVHNLFTVVRKDHTFTHYGFNGALIVELLTGTWTLAAPDKAAGPSSIATALSSAGKPAKQLRLSNTGSSRVLKTKQIAFDGFCDGMALTSPSAGLGTKGTVDGTQTGCVSAPLIGAKGKVQGKKKSYAVTLDNGGGGQYLHTAILKDHTWIHYATDGVNEYVLNSGTWSKGPPPRAAQGLPSSFGG